MPGGIPPICSRSQVERQPATTGSSMHSGWGGLFQAPCLRAACLLLLLLRRTGGIPIIPGGIIPPIGGMPPICEHRTTGQIKRLACGAAAAVEDGARTGGIPGMPIGPPIPGGMPPMPGGIPPIPGGMPGIMPDFRMASKFAICHRTKRDMVSRRADSS